MLFTSALALAGLAAASPLVKRDSPSYPETSTSQGFRLVVNVTDSTKDFTPSIQTTYVSSIHVGAGQNLVGIVDDEDSARIFYINGTAGEYFRGQATTVSDGGTPASPYGFTLHEDTQDPSAGMSTARLDAGLGNAGYTLTRIPVPYVFLAPEQMAVCDEFVAYYQKNMKIIKQLNLNKQKTLPANCAPVRLMAECAELNTLEPDSISKHDNVYTASCYEDVSSIDWSKYSKW